MKVFAVLLLSLLGITAKGQDRFPEIAKIKLGPVRDAADQFANRGMDIKLPERGLSDTMVECFPWLVLTQDIIQKLPGFFLKRTEDFSARLDKWRTTYQGEDPVNDIDYEIRFASSGWKAAMRTLCHETQLGQYSESVQYAQAMKAQVEADKCLNVLKQIKSEVKYVFDVPDNHWAYEGIERIRKSGLFTDYPDRLSRGQWPLAGKDFGIAVTKAHHNFVALIEGGVPSPSNWGAQPTLSGAPDLPQTFLELLNAFTPEVVAAGGNPKVIRQDVKRLSPWLKSARWSKTLKRPYLPETPRGHWAEKAMDGLYDAGILVGYRTATRNGG